MTSPYLQIKSADMATDASDSSLVLKPGQTIRPNVCPNYAIKLVSNIWGFDVQQINELDSYDDRNFHVMVREEHSNPFVDRICTHGYVLKVLNSLQSRNLDIIDGQNQMMLHLNREGFTCQIPIQTLKGELQTVVEIPREEPNANCPQEKDSSSKNLLRLLTYIPGNVLSSVPLTDELLYAYGKYVGQITKCLSTFSHPAIASNVSMWVLASTPKLRDFTFAIKDEKNRDLVESVLSAFEEEVMTNIESFRKGILHGDMNDLNVLILKDEGPILENKSGYRISGILDFSDYQYSCLVFEIAIGIMYAMIAKKGLHIVDVGGHVLAGYLSECTLDLAEMDAMKVCIAARYCQSLVMGAYTFLQDPSNTYVLQTAKEGWGQLKKFWETPKVELYAIWEEIRKMYRNN